MDQIRSHKIDKWFLEKLYNIIKTSKELSALNQ